MKRLLAVLVASAVVAAASLTPAVATEDDPMPSTYPTLEKPGAIGGDQDPMPPRWPGPSKG
ncbi:hypothetical protein OG474_15700 [Kribbella sp. NBC_01505]|uniref:hypothetical protein n=1 Tax=Kribbella sp. NBC_01505 TaxID=2903580 RepID=UPI00386325D1